MKGIKKVLLILIGFFAMIEGVYAASGTISVTGSTSAVLGNTVTYTVTISSSTEIGSWQVDLDYDSKYLKLTSTTAEAGGTYMVNSSNGIKSKTYKFSFKTLKTGSTKISIGSYYVIANNDMTSMSMKTTSTSLKIMTQAELEATYSSDATLKSLGVEGYNITPEFNSSTYEYGLEVENAVTAVNIVGAVNDNKSGVTGIGVVNLEEGINTIQVVVTAQKGNQLTYTINIDRKELAPIEVNVDGQTYRLVRKKTELPLNNRFIESTVLYEENEIPALYNETIDYYIVGLKDAENNIKMYRFKDNQFTSYNELDNQIENIIPITLKENELFKKYKKVSVIINGREVKAYQLEKENDTVIIYALNIDSNEENYYTYNLKNNTYIKENMEKDKHYDNIIKYYQYILIGSFSLIVVLLLILLFRPSKKKNNETNEVKVKESTISTKPKKGKSKKDTLQENV